MEEAKETLQELKDRAESGAQEDQDEMRRLEDFIAEHSKRAERAITSGNQMDEG